MAGQPMDIKTVLNELKLIKLSMDLHSERVIRKLKEVIGRAEAGDPEAIDMVTASMGRLRSIVDLYVDLANNLDRPGLNVGPPGPPGPSPAGAAG